MKTGQVRLYTKASAERVMQEQEGRCYIVRVTTGPSDVAIDVAPTEPCAACGHTFDEHHSDEWNDGGFCFKCPKSKIGAPTCCAFAFPQKNAS